MGRKQKDGKQPYESRNWCITFWEEPKKDEKKWEKKIQYLVYQKEECPTTKREHWQAYCEFKCKMTVAGIRKLFNVEKMRCAIRNGTQAEATKYCIKSDTRLEEPVHYGVQKMQGIRNDIDGIYEDITEGFTTKEILQKHKGNALRMIHCITKAIKINEDCDLMDAYILAKRKVFNKDGTIKPDATMDDKFKYFELQGKIKKF